jgi:hypothetical protein
MPESNRQPKATKRKRAKASAKAKATTATKRKAGTTAKRKTTTKTKRRASARSATKANTSARTATAGSRSRRPRQRSAGLPRDLLKSFEDGQHAAADALRKFVETVDSALPLRGESAPRGQEVVDSALEMTERLVQTQVDVVRKVVRSAGRTFGDSVKRS